MISIVRSFKVTFLQEEVFFNHVIAYNDMNDSGRNYYSKCLSERILYGIIAFQTKYGRIFFSTDGHTIIKKGLPLWRLKVIENAKRERCYK